MSKMKHAMKIVLSTTGVSLLVMFLLSLAILPSDAAAILDTPHAAAANVGNSFSIDAWGEALHINDSSMVRALTRMHIEFTIIHNGSRGVVFQVALGTFVMNSTSYTVTEGLGVAGRPSESPYNRTIVFGFRINMTGENGEPLQLAFRGYVDRTETSRPILYMRGRITFKLLEYYLAQRGRIHRIET